MSTLVSLEVLSENVKAKFPVNTPLALALDQLGVAVQYPCGRFASCGKCQVLFELGAPEPSASDIEFFTPSQIDSGWRLACQTTLQKDAALHIPIPSRGDDSLFVFTSTTAHQSFPSHPAVIRHKLTIDQPTTENPASDRDRLAAAIEARGGFVRDMALTCLQKIPGALRDQNHKATATTFYDILLDVVAGHKTGRLLGAAIDIGTTTVALSLHDLENGGVLRTLGAINPQTHFGDDLISRLTYVAGSEERLVKSQASIVDCINHLLRRACEEHGVSPRDIYHFSIAGNAAMNHIFLGVPPENMAIAPFVPVFREPVVEPAASLGLMGHPAARITLLPNIGGFVGGDTVADLVTTEMLDKDEWSLLIDIGTNCEVVLGRRGEGFLATSAPAGPALEGACISAGMRAERGAIDDVRLENNALVLHTIDSAPPRGLCGSGLFHAVAALYEWGIITAAGRILPPAEITNPAIRQFLAQRVSIDARGQARILLASDLSGAERDVWLTQNDVREFQLAKGAIAAGWRMLAQDFGITEQQIDRVYIAGAFGNYIRPEAVRLTGLVPNLPIAKIDFIGNGALEGARRVLLNRDDEARARGIIKEVKFVELAGRDEFQETFALEMSMPPISKA